MKKRFCIALCIALMLCLCACGAKDSTPETTNTPAAPATEAPAAETAAPETEAPETEPAAQTDAAEDPAEIARSFIDKPLSELIAALGEPESSDYASSCMGDGEDGLLSFDGFVVYTYREGDSETVTDVE